MEIGHQMRIAVKPHASVSLPANLKFGLGEAAYGTSPKLGEVGALLHVRVVGPPLLGIRIQRFTL